MIMAVSTGVLLLLLGSVVLTYAQHGHHKKNVNHPKQEQRGNVEKKQQQAKPARKQQQGQQQAKQPSQQGQHGSKSKLHAVWQKYRAHNWQSEHRSWQERGGYNGYRIPRHRYRGYFGPNHTFRIYRYPLIVVGGYPRFQYNGFWFSAVDPWPEYWADNWYENDEVYIHYVGDGYYLYNLRYPRDRLAIIVYLK